MAETPFYLKNKTVIVTGDARKLQQEVSNLENAEDMLAIIKLINKGIFS